MDANSGFKITNFVQRLQPSIKLPRKLKKVEKRKTLRKLNEMTFKILDIQEENFKVNGHLKLVKSIQKIKKLLVI